MFQGFSGPFLSNPSTFPSESNTSFQHLAFSATCQDSPYAKPPLEVLEQRPSDFEKVLASAAVYAMEHELFDTLDTCLSV